MSRFFIDRPIFAWVIALVIMLAGGLSILKLPINQYPSIAPPAVSIQVSYPGASAQTVQDTVVQVIEQQLNGIDGLRYVSSASNSDGSMEIIVTFEQGGEPGYRPGSGAEQAATGDTVATAGSPATGHPCDQVGEQLPHDHRRGVERRQHDP